MKEKLANFFTGFNENLTDALGSTFDYPKLLAYLKRKKASLSLDSEYEDIDWLDELVDIVEKIKEIVNNVNPNINPEEDFLQSEYNSHEDRFIVFLIDQIASLLARTTSTYASASKCLDSYYVGHNIPLSDAGKINGLNLLTTQDKNYLHVQRKLFQLREVISLLVQTNYYLFLKEVPFDEVEDIYPNGALAIFPLYAPCYAYYEKLKSLLAVHLDKPCPNINIHYHTYVLARLFLALDEKGFALSGASPDFDNKDSFMRIRNLKLAKGKLFVTITSENDDHIDLLFEDGGDYVKADKKKKQSKVSLDLAPTLAKELLSEDEAKAYFSRKVNKRLSKGYTNAYYITGVQGAESSEAILCLPYTNQLDVNLSSMLDSCLLYLPGDHFTYSHLCPICGAHVEKEDDNGSINCERCGSAYSLLAMNSDKEKKEMIWVKRLKNLEGK